MLLISGMQDGKSQLLHVGEAQKLCKKKYRYKRIIIHCFPHYHEILTCIILTTVDTLGPAISGSFLLLYRGFPLSEVKMC